jgi:hypothetical protein
MMTVMMMMLVMMLVIHDADGDDGRGYPSLPIVPFASATSSSAIIEGGQVSICPSPQLMHIGCMRHQVICCASLAALDNIANQPPL